MQERLKEAIRISKNLKHLPKVLPYWWYTYQDKESIFLTEVSIILFGNLEHYAVQSQTKTSPLFLIIKDFILSDISFLYSHRPM